MKLIILFHVFVLWEMINGNIDEDLTSLSKMLPGTYSNRNTNINALPGATEDGKTLVVMKALYRPVTLTFLPHAFNVYVEQTLKAAEKPFRQWLYSFTTDNSARAIRLRVFNFMNTSVREKVRKNPSALRYISQSDVTTRSECDMFWRRLGAVFVGTTSRKCIAQLNGEQVRISVLTTLTSSTLQFNEGWYNVKDGSSMVELEGPINMAKIADVHGNSISVQPSPTQEEEIDTTTRVPVKRNSKVPTPTRTRGEGKKIPKVSDSSIQQQEALQKDNGQRHPNHSHLRSNKKRGSKTLNRNIIKTAFAGPHKMWNLRTFRGVIDALENGHKLHFFVDLERCKHTGSVTSDVNAFGGYVNIYEIGNYQGQKQHGYLTFAQRKLIHTDFGFSDVVREITLLRNGSVAIETVLFDESGGFVLRQSKSYCRMFTNDNRRGNVKFSIDTFRQVKQLKSFGALRSSLKKGKIVRLNIDITKCSGGKPTNVITGGEMTNFDLENAERSIQVTLQRTKMFSPSLEDVQLETQFTLVEFMKQNGALVTSHAKQLISNNSDQSIVSGYIRYRCDTDQNSSNRGVTAFVL